MADNKTPLSGGNSRVKSKPVSEELKQNLRQMGRWRPMPKSASPKSEETKVEEPNQVASKTPAGSKRQLSSENSGETPSSSSLAKKVAIDSSNVGEKTAARKRVEELRETVRRLKLAKALGGGTSVDDLKTDIEMWRTGCQNAITHLHSLVNGNHPMTIGELISKLGLDPEMVHFDVENDSFF